MNRQILENMKLSTMLIALISIVILNLFLIDRSLYGAESSCEDGACVRGSGDIFPNNCLAEPCALDSCGDGKVDLLDVYEAMDLVQGSYYGTEEPTSCQLIKGDMPNGTPPYCGNPSGTPNCETDGDFDLFDILVMINKAIGKENCADYCFLIDLDGDGVSDKEDNCPSLSNPDQNDTDADGTGDVCDNCPSDGNVDQGDADGDGIGNLCDNCPNNSNSNQEDMDDDGAGDVCDRNSDCPVIQIYGNKSDEAKLLRGLRDHVLRNTMEGQELIILYYHWSPVIVKAMEEDEEFKEKVKKMIDGVLPMIEDARE